MKISLDFDGVVADTMGLWAIKYNKKYDKNITFADIKEWDFWKGYGLTLEQAFELFHECWEDWRGLKPLEKNQHHIIAKMAQHGQVDLVTSVSLPYIPIVRKWMSNYHIPIYRVVPSDKKYELNYDIFIDDSPKNAIEIDKRKKICLLYDQAWNRNVSGERILRVKNLEEAYGFIARRVEKLYT